MGVVKSGAGISHEKYISFLPALATNVPAQQVVVANFTSMTVNWTVVVWNEEPINSTFPIANPVDTWWEDDFAMMAPIDAYHVTNWTDNGDGYISPSDLVQTNDYWWAPVVSDKVSLKQSCWWRLLEVDYLTLPPYPPHAVRLVLEWTPAPGANPPVCTWWTKVAQQGQLHHLVGWVDNNPDGTLNSGDVAYLKEYNIVQVSWDKIGPGFTLIPVTCRTWHVLQSGPQALVLHRFYYDFNIRTVNDHGDPIQFINEAGAVVDVFEIEDAEYSFKRGLVQDQYGSPMWKFYMPLFDQMNSDHWDTGDPEDAICLSYLIDDAVEIVSSDPPILRINLGIPFNDTSFKQILCGTWASIVSKEFSISIGCWDGELLLDKNQNCYPDWFDTGSPTRIWWRHIDYSPYDGPASLRWVGTGPYFVQLFSPAVYNVILKWNQVYWRGWPASSPGSQGCPSFVKNVDIRYIADWPTRRDAFNACDLDICDVPRALMFDLLDNSTKQPANPAIKTIFNLNPVFAMDTVMFTFNTNASSPYIGTGQFPYGVPTDFFSGASGLNVRKAFAYSFNHSLYLRECWYGETRCRETPDIDGLFPDYYTKGPDPPWTYDENFTAAQIELKAATFPGGSVWSQGFTVWMACLEGDLEAMVACNMVSNFFATLSTAIDTATGAPRIGPPFIVNIVSFDLPWFFREFESGCLPICVMPWQANYADADSCKRPFMHIYGRFAYFQDYTSTTTGPNTGLTKDVLLDLAVKTADTDPLKAVYYSDLDDIYVKDCPSFPIDQPIGRKWLKYWVKGWYYNPLYPSDYYYHIWKNDTCWFDVSGAELPGESGRSDGITNIRDITFLILRFNARPCDDRWGPGTYGYGCTDPYGDRICNIRDITFDILHFNHDGGIP